MDAACVADDGMGWMHHLRRQMGSFRQGTHSAPPSHGGLYADTGLEWPKVDDAAQAGGRGTRPQNPPSSWTVPAWGGTNTALSRVSCPG